MSEASLRLTVKPYYRLRKNFDIYTEKCKICITLHTVTRRHKILFLNIEEPNELRQSKINLKKLRYHIVRGKMWNSLK